jgi:lipid-A-disaccharide synthase
MDAAKPIIGLLPGSRLHEIEHLMPVLLGAARIIHATVRDAQFIIGVAPGISREHIAKYLSGDRSFRDRIAEVWREFGQEAESRIIRPITRSAGVLTGQAQRQLVTVEGVVVTEETLRDRDTANQRSDKLRSDAERVLPPIVIAKGVTSDLMANSDVLLTCSGTATLEAAAFETPMVILYRFSWLMEMEARLLGLKRKIKMIGLPNILAEKMIVPELIQHDASPEAIAKNALRLLNDVEARHEAKQQLHKVREMMGEPGASARTARIVLDLAAA